MACYIWEALRSAQLLGLWEALQLRNFLSLTQGFQNLFDRKTQYLPNTH